MKNKEAACPARKTSIGGQALIEGIMMRGPKKSAMAVRDPKGEMVIEEWENTASKRPAICKWPLIRGVFGFIDSMTVGYKALMRSAEIAIDEEEEEKAKAEKKAKKEEERAKKNKAPKKEKNKEKDGKKETDTLFGVLMGVASVLGVVLAVVLFIVLPNYIYKWLESVIPFLPLENTALNSLVKSGFEGLLRIAVLVGYMALVTLMKDIRRTFMYHGAEHKTIFCYENGLELTVENVKKQRRFHPRCGTSFLILMLLVSMFISFFIDPIFILATGSEAHVAIRSVIKLLLLPINMGIGYELIKLAGKYDNLFTRIISAPGMWLQHVTVLEPEDDMIECAIAAFEKVLPENEKKEEEKTTEE
ncbi:MAG: DUF1385 domain-containing protein [Clostridia bacterium]|nr:DUF1385 domain-containing protein [Clostridia bacterium]